MDGAESSSKEEQAPEDPAGRDQRAAMANYTASHPARPMTYEQLTEFGVERTMPEVLWIPYFSGPSDDQPLSSMLDSSSSEDHHDRAQRQPSRISDSIGRDRNHRNQSLLQAGEAKTKGRSWSQRKVYTTQSPKH